MFDDTARRGSIMSPKRECPPIGMLSLIDRHPDAIVVIGPGHIAGTIDAQLANGGAHSIPPNFGNRLLANDLQVQIIALPLGGLELLFALGLAYP